MDTREKLEADIRQWLDSRLIGNEVYETVISWINRQKAITEREVKEANVKNWRTWCNSLGIPCIKERAGEQIAELQAKIDDLTEERDLLLEQIQEYAEEAANFEQAIADVEKTHMRLPMDADGVPVRIGDTMERICAEEQDVFTVGLIGADGFCMDDETSFFKASECRHVKLDTVESLLEEFHGKLWSDDEEQMALLEEYAERIRMACNG